MKKPLASLEIASSSRPTIDLALHNSTMFMSFDSMQSTIPFIASTLLVEVYHERSKKRKQLIDGASAHAIKMMQQYEMFMV